jgi:hypothetical protein
MTFCKELVDNYESGRCINRGRDRQKKRVLLVEPYIGWEDVEGVPKYGDEWPGDPLLKVVSIEAEGYGGLDSTQTGLHKYKYAKVTVTYSTNPANNYTFMRGDMTAELLSLPQFGYFQQSGNPVEQPRTIPIAMDRFVIPRRSIVRPVSTIYSKLGCINSDNWTPEVGVFTYPPGTVWFAGCPWAKVYDPESGLILYELDYTFIYNPYGWNNAFDVAANQWDVVLPYQSYPAVPFSGFPPS